MLATLSVFFFHHQGQPNAYQAGEIRKWFWATGVVKRYSGAGYSTFRLLSDHLPEIERLFASDTWIPPVTP